MHLHPYHRVAWNDLRQRGLLLPIGTNNHDLTLPNRILFHPEFGWTLLDNADPLHGWEVLATGALHGVLRWCQVTLTKTVANFKISRKSMPMHDEGRQFKRVSRLLSITSIYNLWRNTSWSNLVKSDSVASVVDVQAINNSKIEDFCSVKKVPQDTIFVMLFN